MSCKNKDMADKLSYKFHRHSTYSLVYKEKCLGPFV